MSDLYQKLEEYSHSDYYPYHMPGHKRRLFGDTMQSTAWMDITEIEGFDNLHDAKGMLMKIQKKAASIYGAEESFYLVNGSTSGILSAISAALPQGGKLLMVRGCHKSAYHAAYLRNLDLKYLWTGLHPEFRCNLAVSVQEVEEALQLDKTIQAVFIVSPTYEGLIADVEKITEAVHKRGIPLIVDEAHGAHLGFHPAWARNSARLGADLVVNSLHKTLAAPTQTAILHVNGTLINREKLKRFLGIYLSSSPSYPLMAGMEEAINITDLGKESLFADFKKHWKTMLDRLQACQCIRILQESNSDIGKLVIRDKTGYFTGQQLYEVLLHRYHLQMEMAAGSYVLALFTVADTAEGYDRLTKALLEIDKECSDRNQSPYLAADSENISTLKLYQTEESIKPRQIYSLSEAWDMESEDILLAKAGGRLSGSFINLYPPGIPLIVPGEELTEDICISIQGYIKSGFNVQGIRKSNNMIFIKALK